ncbi:hypothetical protein GCM10009774_22430 [Cellulomonas gelida]|uniref:Uncharacterized protein n=1 Tax=Cellulomonas gelida TaxID=1712 RepID=A0A4Y3KIH2_9CELL|nr:hypothetical protein CGE01nite_09540 [Cellulomonas gelida]GGL31518.1 hypothetical protein GCM10009774_22430 [Cellulomonas gelida]
MRNTGLDCAVHGPGVPAPARQRRVAGVQARATRACTPVVGLRGPGQPIFSALVAVELSTVVVDWNVARTWYEPFARTGSTTE